MGVSPSVPKMNQNTHINTEIEHGKMVFSWVRFLDSPFPNSVALISSLFLSFLIVFPNSWNCHEGYIRQNIIQQIKGG